MIEPGTNGRCAHRAISIMRLAIGLDGRLPQEFPDGPLLDRDLVTALPIAFPGHRVRVWHGNTGTLKDITPDPLQYCGDIYPGEYDVDEWIVAFSYQNEHGSAHCVIGYPVVYEGIKLNLVFAVLPKA